MSSGEITSIVFDAVLASIILGYIVWLLINKVTNFKASKKFKEFIRNDEDMKKKFAKDKTQKEFENTMKKYFKKVVVGTLDAKFTFKFFAIDIHKENSQGRNLAWDFFTLLTTSVIGNKAEGGKVSEAIESIYSVFKRSRELLINLDGYSVVSDVILKILNKKLRPILNWSRDFAVSGEDGKFVLKEENFDDNSKREFWGKLDKLRKSLLEDGYLKFIALCSGSMLLNKQISELINYGDDFKESKRTKKAEEKLTKDVSELKGGE